MLCVLSPTLFVYYSSAFGGKTPPFDHLLPETAVTELTIMSFVCFLLAAEHGVAELLLLAYLHMFAEVCYLRANESILVPLSSQMRANVLCVCVLRGLSRVIIDCAVDPVAAALAFARLGKTSWAAPD